jgi:hypothetical protein
MTNSSLGAGRYAAVETDDPHLLYDRDVRTRVWILDADRLRAEVRLRDDTLGPTGFATVHEMTLEAIVSRPDLTIVDVRAGMEHHPHGSCPLTLRQMDQLVGLQVGKGYFRELSSRFGGNRGCNHLHSMAQSLGTVIALTLAATLTHDEPETLQLGRKEWFANVIDKEPRIVDSCVIWHEDGPLMLEIDQLRKDHGR